MEEQQLLLMLIQLTGRIAFSQDSIREILLKGGGGPKQISAYNLCDGTKAQADIAREVGIDPGNFSRTVTRWISEGILFRLGEGRGSTVLHIYPISETVEGD